MRACTFRIHSANVAVQVNREDTVTIGKVLRTVDTSAVVLPLCETQGAHLNGSRLFALKLQVVVGLELLR